MRCTSTTKGCSRICASPPTYQYWNCQAACGLSLSLEHVENHTRTWCTSIPWNNNARAVARGQPDMPGLVEFCVDILRGQSNCSLQHPVDRRHPIPMARVLNTHYWALMNPFCRCAMKHQMWWSTNLVQYLKKKKQFVGSVFYEGQLTGDKYLQLLQESLPNRLDDLLRELLSLWFQLDGAPAHQTTMVQGFQSNTFGQQVIGYGGQVKWPPQSPDLTQMDCFLWGFLKAQVYMTESTCIADLHHCIINVCNIITSDMLENIQQNVLSNIDHCTRRLLWTGHMFLMFH